MKHFESIMDQLANSKPEIADVETDSELEEFMADRMKSDNKVPGSVEIANEESESEEESTVFLVDQHGSVQ